MGEEKLRERADAITLYRDVLKPLYSDPHRDINGGDLVEFLGLIMTKPPGTWVIESLAESYGFGKEEPS